MFCIHCGKENPDESTYCIKCGERVVTGSGVSNRMLILAGSAAAVSILFGVISLFGDQMKSRQATPSRVAASPSPIASPTQPVTEVEMIPAEDGSSDSGPHNIVSETIRIEPKSFRAIRFMVEPRPGTARLSGEVVAAGGGRDDIYLLILDDAGLQDYRHKSGYSTYLETRVTDRKQVSVTLPAGSYHVVFSNTHARFYPKRVRADLKLSYE
ncbi:MAG: zinc-ribbon domain-containing protein [Acidobacteria bacterium]|nr:zinc-ribbon domain-containing protein [Acidobacteriota bacterium]